MGRSVPKGRMARAHINGCEEKGRGEESDCPCAAQRKGKCPHISIYIAKVVMQS